MAKGVYMMKVNLSTVEQKVRTFLPDMPKYKQVKVKEGELPDFFRDSELFDPKKDKITEGYFKYDTDDCALNIVEHGFGEPLNHDSVYMFDSIG